MAQREKAYFLDLSEQLFILPFTNTVTWRASMAGLTHCYNVTQHIRTSSRKPVHFPFAPQYCAATPGMVTASFHGAFTFSACSLVNIFSNRHFVDLLC